MLYVLETWQIVYGFDISGFGGKVVSVTVLTMFMTDFLFNFSQIWRNLGNSSVQIRLLVSACFFT